MRKIGLNFLSAALFSMAAATVNAQSFEQNLYEENENGFALVKYEEAYYPGGYAALQADADRCVNYPSQAYERGIEGEVIVEFSIETDGSVSNVHCIRQTGTVFYEAVEHFIGQTMWIPAKANGISIRTSLKLPLAFRLKSK